MKRPLAAALLLAFTPACFGSFGLERKLWGFNKDVSNQKIVQELVFLALAILPVYALAGLGDIFIFNLIEFWTGNNPVMTAQTADGRDVRVARSASGDGMRIEIEGRDAVDLRIAGSAVEARALSGELLARVTAQGDRAVVTDGAGALRAELAIAELRAAFQRGPRAFLLAAEQASLRPSRVAAAR